MAKILDDVEGRMLEDIVLLEVQKFVSRNEAEAHLSDLRGQTQHGDCRETDTLSERCG